MFVCFYYCSYYYCYWFLIVDCHPEETCGGNGICDYLGECQCNGNYDGKLNCTQCLPDFHYDNCSVCMLLMKKKRKEEKEEWINKKIIND